MNRKQDFYSLRLEVLDIPEKIAMPLEDILNELYDKIVKDMPLKYVENITLARLMTSEGVKK